VITCNTLLKSNYKYNSLYWCIELDLFRNKIDSSEIIKIVNSYKDETAAGYDKVTIKMLKYIIEFVINPLVYIYNLSLEQNVFPNELKLTAIKPIHKGGDPTNINSYRPI
jgi:hypothetical protein